MPSSLHSGRFALLADSGLLRPDSTQDSPEVPFDPVWQHHFVLDVQVAPRTRVTAARRASSTDRHAFALDGDDLTRLRDALRSVHSDIPASCSAIAVLVAVHVWESLDEAEQRLRQGQGSSQVEVGCSTTESAGFWVGAERVRKVKREH